MKRKQFGFGITPTYAELTKLCCLKCRSEVTLIGGIASSKCTCGCFEPKEGVYLKGTPEKPLTKIGRFRV